MDGNDQIENWNDSYGNRPCTRDEWGESSNSNSNSDSVKELRKDVMELKNTVMLLLKEKRKRSVSPSSIGCKGDEAGPSKVQKRSCEQNETDILELDELDALSIGLSNSEEGELEASDDEGLQDLESSFKTSSVKGTNIDDKIAKIIDSGLCKKLSEEKFRSIGEKYPPPGNCNNIRVPRTNHEIWKFLSKSQKSKDIKLQKTQNICTKTITAAVKMLDDVRKAKKEKVELDLKKVETTISDIIRLSSACFSDISDTRKDNMKSGLAERYRPLCNKDDDNQSTEFLFGDNLAQKIKDLGESSRIASTIQNQRQNPKNFQRGRIHYHQNQKMSQNNPTGDDPRKVFYRKNQRYSNQQYKKTY